MQSNVDKIAEAGSERGQLSTEEAAKVIENGEKIQEKITGSECKKYKKLIPYHDMICKYMSEGIHQAEIIRKIRAQGYSGGKSAAEYYIKSLREKYKIDIPQRTSTPSLQPPGIKIGQEVLVKKELMERIWMGKGFTAEEKDILNRTHPGLLYAEICVRNFKKIFDEKNIALLHLFIEKYACCTIKKLSDFSRGLLKDIDAVENAVTSKKSNGFVEGTNSRIKMIKRTMFGRCGLTLLSAKLMFRKW